MNLKKVISLFLATAIFFNIPGSSLLVYADDYLITGGVSASSGPAAPSPDGTPHDDNSTPQPCPIPAKPPAVTQSGPVAEPVNIYDGKFYYNRSFLTVPGRIPINISCNYSSFSTFNGQLGYGWSFIYKRITEDNRVRPGKLKRFDN